MNISTYSLVWILVSISPKLVQGESVELDFENTPDAVIYFSRRTVMKPYQISLKDPSRYKFVVILEQMYTYTCSGSKGAFPSVIVDRGDMYHSRCASHLNFHENMMTKYFWISNTSLQVSGSGTWRNWDEAILVATIFQEVAHCSSCPNNTICCGDPLCNDTQLKRPPGRTDLQNLTVARCIPVAVICNGHPTICNVEDNGSANSGVHTSSFIMQQFRYIELWLITVSVLYIT